MGLTKMENLIIYALIAFVLYLVIPREKKQEVMKRVECNYALYRLELLTGGKDES